ncbi:aldo/keto reductase [Candidatus Poribacteria bacterium]|nr:aldo/keto reductase [Candidatus Poribacteria bacterium]
MRKVILGKSDLAVTEVGFGGIPIQRLTHKKAVEVVQACIDMGVNYIDTANGYGTSEERIGDAVSDRRGGLVIASKSPGRDAKTYNEHLKLSLKRLQTDYIDLYQFHNVSREDEYEKILAPGGAMEAAQKAREEGVIGHIGITSHKMDMAIKAVKSGLFETLMFPFNYISNESEDELLDLCKQNNIGFIAMKPMGGGLLDDACLSFKYLKQFPHIVPIVGIETLDQMQEIISIVETTTKVTDADRQAIKNMQEELGKRFCRACDYCQPCPEELPISALTRLRSFAKRFPEERFFGEWGNGLVKRAEDCADCGGCESRCPYDLPVREMIKENVAWYNEQMALR